MAGARSVPLCACAADNNNVARWASGRVCTLVEGRSAAAENIGRRRRACVCLCVREYAVLECVCVLCVTTVRSGSATVDCFYYCCCYYFFFFLLLFSLRHLRCACVCLSAECSARHRPVHMR